MWSIRQGHGIRMVASPGPCWYYRERRTRPAGSKGLCSRAPVRGDVASQTLLVHFSKYLSRYTCIHTCVHMYTCGHTHAPACTHLHTRTPVHTHAQAARRRHWHRKPRWGWTVLLAWQLPQPRGPPWDAEPTAGSVSSSGLGAGSCWAISTKE